MGSLAYLFLLLIFPFVRTISAANSLGNVVTAASSIIITSDDGNLHTSTYVVPLRSPDELQAAIKRDCALWDPSCKGNSSFAMTEFFGRRGVRENLLADDYQCHATGGYPCDFTISSTQYASIKSWMRTPQCQTMLRNFKGERLTYPYEKQDETCCTVCRLAAGNIEVFYWPEPDADTSCLSIVGEESHYPIDYGATTASNFPGDSNQTYWGCTSTMTDTTEYVGTVTTAWLNSINGHTYKEYSDNPWTKTLCHESSEEPSSITKAPSASPTISTKIRSLTIPAGRHQNGSQVSTVVMSGYTFTSPSVYALFTNLGASDLCGETLIPTTMFSFASGELSTLAGGTNNDWGFKPTTRSFNFKDIPCPPESVARENWWKASLGNPYRPVLAMPSKVQSLNPWYLQCTADTFVGFDPPRTLAPQPTIDPAAPEDPGAVPDQKGPDHAFQKTQGGPMAATPASKPQANVPEQTAQPKPDSGSTARPQDPEQSPKQSPEDHAVDEDPHEPSSAAAKHPPNNAQMEQHAPHQAKPSSAQNDPKSSGIKAGKGNPYGPADLSPDRMSAFHQALVPAASKQVGQDHVQDSPKHSFSGGQVGNPPSPSVKGAPVIVASNDIPATRNTNSAESPVVAKPATTAYNGQTFVPLSNGVSIGGTLLTLGAPAITVSDVPISMGSSALVIGSKSLLVAHQPAGAIVTQIGGKEITLDPTMAILPNTVLTPGAPAAVVGSLTLSLNKASALLVGGSTIALQASSTNEVGLGSIIMDGFGAGPTHSGFASESSSDPSSPNSATDASSEGVAATASAVNATSNFTSNFSMTAAAFPTPSLASSASGPSNTSTLSSSDAAASHISRQSFWSFSMHILLSALALTIVNS